MQGAYFRCCVEYSLCKYLCYVYMQELNTNFKNIAVGLVRNVNFLFVYALASYTVHILDKAIFLLGDRNGPYNDMAGLFCLINSQRACARVLL